jgi:hypothetical protein
MPIALQVAPPAVDRVTAGDVAQGDAWLLWIVLDRFVGPPGEGAGESRDAGPGVTRWPANIVYSSPGSKNRARCAATPRPAARPQAHASQIAVSGGLARQVRDAYDTAKWRRWLLRCS